MTATVEIPTSPRPKPNEWNLVEEFERDCKDRHFTEDTIRVYKSSLRIFIRFLQQRQPPVSVFQVDKHILKDFIHERRSLNVDQNTLENNFGALSTFYEFLCFNEYTNINPILPVRKHYLRRYKEESESDQSARKLASVEEMEILINSILNRRDKAVVTVLAKTGLRRRELVSIDIHDIDWIDQSITLKKLFKKRSNRTVFFDDECALVLKKWIAQREKLNAKTEALFTNEYGGRLNRNGVYNLVTKYAEAIGLHDPKSERIEDHFSPHNCRHWFTTWLRRNGMPREFIQELRGDRRREAIDIYDHIDKEELRKAYLAFIPKLGID